MSTIKSLFGGLNAITCTIASLASGAAQGSVAVDNSSNQYLDAQLTLLIAVAAGSPSGSKVINIYGYRSVDGTNFDDPAPGTDGAITVGSPTNLILLESINVPTGGKTYSKQIASLAAKFGGVLPIKWGLVIENQTGVALSGSGHSLQYRGLFAQTQ
jgi:hypothetical protein